MRGLAVSWLCREKFSSAWLEIEISVVGNGSTWKNRDTNFRRLLSTITMLYNTNIIIAHDKVRNSSNIERPMQEDSSHISQFPCRGLVHIQRINDSSTYWIRVTQIGHNISTYIQGYTYTLKLDNNRKAIKRFRKILSETLRVFYFLIILPG